MKLILSLITTALVSSVVSAAPMGDTSRVSINDVIRHKSLQTNNETTDFIESKRDFGDDYSEEKGREELVDILNHLRGYVSGEDIDYNTYNMEFQQSSATLAETEHFIVTRLDGLSEELRITKRFYDSFGDAWEMFEKFDGCDYPGSELVEELMDLHVRVLSLYRFESLGESPVEDYETQVSGLKSELQDLEEEPREGMMQGIEAIFTKQLKQIKESLSLVEKSNLSSSTGKKSTNQTPKKDCPAI